jgi:anti-sigma factor RsiW
LLHGYLDGELDPLRAQEFERHLEACGQCTAQLEEQETLRGAMRAAKLYERAPKALGMKIKKQVAHTDEEGHWSWVPIVRWVLASVLIVLVTAGSYLTLENLLTRKPNLQEAAVTELIDAHIRSLQAGHLTDVTSTDQHTVKPWFAGKLDYVPTVQDFAEKGFPLLGGRLDVMQGRSVAVLVYGKNKHRVNVFVWPENGQPADIAARGSRNGYQWEDWREHGMEYFVISDVPADDLQQLSGLLGKQ